MTLIREPQDAMWYMVVIQAHVERRRQESVPISLTRDKGATDRFLGTLMNGVDSFLTVATFALSDKVCRLKIPGKLRGPVDAAPVWWPQAPEASDQWIHPFTIPRVDPGQAVELRPRSALLVPCSPLVRWTA